MQFIDYEVSEHIAHITFNRPERLNAMGQQMFADLGEALQKFEDDDEARIAIVTGKGRAFSAGADVKELREIGQIKHQAARRDWDGLARVTKPIIAAVNGLAYGVGFFIAVFCDIRIAAESATFCVSEIKRGRFAAAQIPIQQGIPYCLAMELGLGEVITAQRACQAGLINFVVPDSELMPTAQAMAKRISELPFRLVKLTKAVLRDRLFPTEQVTALSEFITEIRRESAVVKEGIKSFTEKREAKF